jgi:hypothetical protein
MAAPVVSGRSDASGVGDGAGVSVGVGVAVAAAPHAVEENIRARRPTKGGQRHISIVLISHHPQSTLLPFSIAGDESSDAEKSIR